MSDPGAASEAAKAIGDTLGTFGALLAGFVPEGPLRAAVLLVCGLCVAIAPFIYKYYLGVLAQGAQPEGSLERQDYDRLRASLAGGNLAARLYAKWLTAFLDRVERFFGDVGMVDQTLFPHAFGLKIPAPLWTAPAFDRCLLLALIYPIATIFLIWTISGHVGSAEAALGFRPDLPDWQRGTAAAGIGIYYLVLWRAHLNAGWKHIGRRFAFAAATAVALVFATEVDGAGAFAALAPAFFATAVAGPIVYGGPFAYPGAPATAAATVFVSAMALFASIPAVAIAGSTFFFVIAVVIVFAVAAATATVRDFYGMAIKQRWQRIFLALFLPVMIAACLVAAELLSPLKSWGVLGPLLLFLGLLTLLNALFDWASLGLTRALLQRGLELGGWWPYLLALVDAALAGVIIELLVLTMVLGVQAFDELAVHGGGKAVLPLDALFEGIAKNPAAPEYWWAYALLLSSMIPSLINLAISGVALTRGIPWLARILLQWIPDGKAVPE